MELWAAHVRGRRQYPRNRSQGHYFLHSVPVEDEEPLRRPKQLLQPAALYQRRRNRLHPQSALLAVAPPPAVPVR